MAGFDAVALQKYHWIEKIDHVHTAGNSSASSTAPRWCWSATRTPAGAGLTPRARVVAAAVSGADPHHADRPGPGGRKALAGPACA